MKVLLRITGIIWAAVFLLLLFILAGCKSVNSLFLIESKEATIEDTAFDESKRNWADVYRQEIKASVENEDIEAYNFFFQEYMRERIRQLREKQKNKNEEE